MFCMITLILKQFKILQNGVLKMATDNDDLIKMCPYKVDQKFPNYQI